MDTSPTPTNPLAQPTRARLFSLLVELKRAASTEELAEHLGLHVNGVRRQLEQLCEAGLVERRKASYGRGRPRDEWAIAPGAAPGGESPRAYRDLAGWLVRAIPPGPGRLRQIERTGREIGRKLAPTGVESSAQAFEQALSALGCQPELEIADGGKVNCRLGNCPYRDSVRENPEVVCGLHRGITAGLLDELAPEARLTAFEPHDPDRAGCLVEVSGVDWTQPEPTDPVPGAGGR